MRDDARTRAHEVLFAAFGSGGSIIHVNPYHAVDALLAAGWRPPVSDDTKAKATEVAADALRLGAISDVTAAADTVAALADAGLLAEPSHLDRLAAWADADPMRYLRIFSHAHGGTVEVGVGRWDDLCDIDEIDHDVQEAARRVLARLEATDG